MITTFKTKTNPIATREVDVAAATQAVVETAAATRTAWDRVKDLRAALEDSPDSLALAAGLRDAEQRHREAGDRDDAAHAALKAAEQALVAAREAPQRAELVKALKARRARIEALKNKVLPDLRELTAEILETHSTAILWALPGAGQQVHTTLLDHLEWLVEHLQNPAGLTWSLEQMAALERGVSDGSKAATLGQNFAKQRRVAA
jgi:vacuolar-type H+-ATPase subunit F/Vma7